MKKILFAIVIASTALFGCGGDGSSSDSSDSGSDDSSSSTTKASGRAIDGYIVGATVFYDFNLNGTQDADEPSAVTTAGGEFYIDTDDLTEDQTECTAYVPLIVDVPVGAVDETEGVVTEAYELSFPPTFIFDGTDTLDVGLNITPLSTVLWDSAVISIEEDLDDGYTCAGVRDDATVQANVKQTIDTVSGDLVFNLNMSEDEIWSDYIASGSVEMYEISQKLMVALRLGFSETYDLTEANPGAYVTVSYYPTESLDTASDGDTWYKKTSIRDDDGYSETIYRVNDEWAEAGLLRSTNTDAVVIDSGETVTIFHQFRTSNSVDGVYLCDVKESIEVNVDGSDDRYTLTNSAITYGGEKATCMDSEFAVSADQQAMYITTERFADFNDVEGTRYVWNTVPSAYDYLVGFSDDAESFDTTTFIADAEVLPRVANDGQDTVGADIWYNYERTIVDGNQTSISYNSEATTLESGAVSYHFIATFYDDGTYTYMCDDTNGGYYDCTK